MRATDICGHVKTDMTWDVKPMDIRERRHVAPEFMADVDSVNLRLRPDYHKFADRHHRLNAGHLCELDESDGVRKMPKGLKSVDVRISRRIVESYEGPIEQHKTKTITLGGTEVRSDLALPILDRYPTVIEEVPEEVPEKVAAKKRR